MNIKWYDDRFMPGPPPRGGRGPTCAPCKTPPLQGAVPLPLRGVGPVRAAALAMLLVLLPAAPGCGGAPQVGPDREAIKAVDALYTAVGLRDARLVAECAARLDALRDAGRLPAPASRALGSIVAEAQAGRWEPAQGRLIALLEGQFR